MTIRENEFSDLMPHIIKVTGEQKYNDYGKEIPGSGIPREYHCLIDDATTTVRNVGGEEVTVGLTAYVWAVPVNSIDGLPVDIESSDKIEIVTPRPQTRPVIAIERHYDSDKGIGYLHNLVVRFS